MGVPPNLGFSIINHPFLGTSISRTPGHLAFNHHCQVFALVRSDGRLVTWGHPAYGGGLGRSAHGEAPWNVAAVTVGCRALAALLADGRVQTFGDAEWGGDAGISTVFPWGWALNL